MSANLYTNDTSDSILLNLDDKPALSSGIPNNEMDLIIKNFNSKLVKYNEIHKQLTLLLNHENQDKEFSHDLINIVTSIMLLKPFIDTLNNLKTKLGIRVVEITSNSELMKEIQIQINQMDLNDKN